MNQENREQALHIQEPYRPPNVDLPAAEAPVAAGAFYVVAPSKFLILFVLTVGMYAFYWFYRNWRQYRAHSREYVSPFWRAVLSIFFTHKLFRCIDVEAGRVKAAVRWSPDGMATLYVVLTIIANVLDRVSSTAVSTPLAIVALACGLGAAYPLYEAQRVANVACGDARGSSNRAFTAANCIFILLGGVLWILIFIGMTVQDG